MLHGKHSGLITSPSGKRCVGKRLLLFLNVMRNKEMYSAENYRNFILKAGRTNP